MTSPLKVFPEFFLPIMDTVNTEDLNKHNYRLTMCMCMHVLVHGHYNHGIQELDISTIIMQSSFCKLIVRLPPSVKLTLNRLLWSLLVHIVHCKVAAGVYLSCSFKDRIGIGRLYHAPQKCLLQLRLYASRQALADVISELKTVASLARLRDCFGAG